MQNIRIPMKFCPICSKIRKSGSSLIGHTVPEQALERFINSKESIFEDDNSVRRYMNKLSENSRPSAIRGLMRFCWIVGKTPKELLAMNPKRLKMLLEDFETYVLEKYENPTYNLEQYFPKHTCLQVSKAIKGFIKANGVGLTELEYKSIFTDRIFKMAIPKQKDYAPTKKDIRTAYSHAPESSKLLLHFLTNVPLRRGELKHLTWKKLGDLAKPYPKIDFFDVELKGSGKGKYKDTHLTMIISESLRKELLKHKESERQRFKDNGILITDEQFENLQVFLSSDTLETEEGKKILPLSKSAIGNLFNDLQRKSRIPLSCHSFRYYVQGVTIKVLGKDSPFTYYFIGHKLPMILAKYSKIWQNKDEVLEEFKKVEPYLDLFYDETKLGDQLKLRAFELWNQKKPLNPEEQMKALGEVVDTILKERSQMLIKEMTELKETMFLELRKAEKEYKRRYEE